MHRYKACRYPGGGRVKVQGKCYRGIRPNALWFARDDLRYIGSVHDVATANHYVFVCFETCTCTKLHLWRKSIFLRQTKWLPFESQTGWTLICSVLFSINVTADIFANRPNALISTWETEATRSVDFLGQINAFLLECRISWPAEVPISRAVVKWFQIQTSARWSIIDQKAKQWWGNDKSGHLRDGNKAPQFTNESFLLGEGTSRPFGSTVIFFHGKPFVPCLVPFVLARLPPSTRLTHVVDLRCWWSDGRQCPRGRLVVWTLVKDTNCEVMSLRLIEKKGKVKQHVVHKFFEATRGPLSVSDLIFSSYLSPFPAFFLKMVFNHCCSVALLWLSFPKQEGTSDVRPQPICPRRYGLKRKRLFTWRYARILGQTKQKHFHFKTNHCLDLSGSTCFSLALVPALHQVT